MELVFVLLGAIFAGIGGYQVYRKRRLARAGQRVPGTVVDMREQVNMGNGGTETRSWKPVVDFRTLDGRDIQAEVSGGVSGFSAVGAHVGVIYDPRNPNHAEIDTFTGRSPVAGYAILFFGLLFAVIGLAAVR